MLFITDGKWLMTLGHRRGIVPVLGDWKWPSPLPAKGEAALGLQQGRSSLLTLGSRKELWFQSGPASHPAALCQCQRRQEGLCIAAATQRQVPERHKKRCFKKKKIKLGCILHLDMQPRALVSGA